MRAHPTTERSKALTRTPMCAAMLTALKMSEIEGGKPER